MWVCVRLRVIAGRRQSSIWCRHRRLEMADRLPQVATRLPSCMLLSPQHHQLLPCSLLEHMALGCVVQSHRSSTPVAFKDADDQAKFATADTGSHMLGCKIFTLSSRHQDVIISARAHSSLNNVDTCGCGYVQDLVH